LGTRGLTEVIFIVAAEVDDEVDGGDVFGDGESDVMRR
jgi:hypothetical protein